MLKLEELKRWRPENRQGWNLLQFWKVGCIEALIAFIIVVLCKHLPSITAWCNQPLQSDISMQTKCKWQTLCTLCLSFPQTSHTCLPMQWPGMSHPEPAAVQIHTWPLHLNLHTQLLQRISILPFKNLILHETWCSGIFKLYHTCKLNYGKEQWDE